MHHPIYTLVVIFIFQVLQHTFGSLYNALQVHGNWTMYAFASYSDDYLSPIHSVYYCYMYLPLKRYM